MKLMEKWGSGIISSFTLHSGQWSKTNYLRTDSNATSRMELQSNRIIIKRNRNILTSITTMQMCLVQMIDGRLKQSRPGKARYNVGGMSISGRSKTWKKWSSADILKKRWSQQSHEWTFVAPKTRRRREMDGYRQRRASKGDQWQSGGIDMIPTNQIASRVDGDPKSDA